MVPLPSAEPEFVPGHKRERGPLGGLNPGCSGSGARARVLGVGLWAGLPLLWSALYLSRVAHRVRLCARPVIDSASGLTSFRVT